MDRHEERRNDHIGTAGTNTTNPDVAAASAPPPLGQTEENAAKAVSGPSGAASGALAGGAAGTVILGPVGTAVGALAGAVGGWWAGMGAAEAAPYGEEDEARDRAHFERDEHRAADRAWEDVNAAYRLGHLARQNPDYAGRSFADVEPELRQGWVDELRRTHGEWDAVRRYVESAYARREESLGVPSSDTHAHLTTAEPPAAGSWNDYLTGQPRGYIHPAEGENLGGTPSHQRASYNDPTTG